MKLNAIRRRKKSLPLRNIRDIPYEHFSAISQQGQRLVQKVKKVGFGEDIMEHAVTNDDVDLALMLGEQFGTASRVFGGDLLNERLVRKPGQHLCRVHEEQALAMFPAPIN